MCILTFANNCYLNNFRSFVIKAELYKGNQNKTLIYLLFTFYNNVCIWNMKHSLSWLSIIKVCFALRIIKTDNHFHLQYVVFKNIFKLSSYISWKTSVEMMKTYVPMEAYLFDWMNYILLEKKTYKLHLASNLKM